MSLPLSDASFCAGKGKNLQNIFSKQEETQYIWTRNVVDRTEFLAEKV